MRSVKIKDYNYQLPPERIAQFPLEQRDRSKLLVWKNGIISDDIFRSLAEYVPENSLLVFNDTRVIRARLLFRKETGALIEIFCLEPLEPSDYALSLSSTEPVSWTCLAGNLKKWKSGKISLGFVRDHKRYILTAERTGSINDAIIVRFSWEGCDLTFGEVIESAGHVPLPPYIERADIAEDASRYQTIYSMVRGSVAAPTAGLHFTREVFDSLDKKGIGRANITLHVGAGTFQPVKAESISDHKMHSEHFFVRRATIEALLKNEGKIICTGTTTVRTVESLYWLGLKISEDPGTDPAALYVDQWEPYTEKTKAIGPAESLETILDWMNKKGLDFIHVSTRIIIVPGYEFRYTGGIITNFHQPGSTLLLLVSAWTGSDWKRIYDYALNNGFRFLSYGDSSVLL